MKNLNDLRELQVSIQDAVQARRNESAMESVLYERPPISIQERLEIYQDSYDARLEESLRDDFERVQAQLDSAELFEKIIQDFIRQVPSTVRNIAEYSEDFTTFVGKKHPELYENALLDWYCLVAEKMPDIASTQILSVQEVQQGIPFQVKAFPSTILFKAGRKYFMTLRKHDEIETQEISSADSDLIEFLRTSRSVDDFVEKAQNLKIEDVDIAKKINEWITNQVIYCERV